MYGKQSLTYSVCQDVSQMANQESTMPDCRLLWLGGAWQCNDRTIYNSIP